MKNSVFTQVDYRQFRQTLAEFDTAKIRSKGYETVIYKNDDILAIMHAASIDDHGQCYPATYYVRRYTPSTAIAYSPLAKVA